MVFVNANLDLKTFEVVDTGLLNESLRDLSDDLLYITFVARDRDFFNGARRYKDKTHMHIVLPYDEVLTTENFDLLAYQYLYKNLGKLKWMDVESMKNKLEKKIAAISDE